MRKKGGSFAAHITQKKPLITELLGQNGKNLDILLSTYDNFMWIGDLNAEPTKVAISDFCEIYNLKHLIKDKLLQLDSNPEPPSS